MKATDPEKAAVALIALAGGASRRDTARALGLSPETVTRIAARLKAAGNGSGRRLDELTARVNRAVIRGDLKAALRRALGELRYLQLAWAKRLPKNLGLPARRHRANPVQEESYS